MVVVGFKLSGGNHAQLPEEPVDPQLLPEVLGHPANAELAAPFHLHLSQADPAGAFRGGQLAQVGAQGVDLL